MAILISTPEDLDNVRNNLSGTYKLANNIDMSQWGNFEPIGIFRGYFDGDGYVISNLSIDRTTSLSGLFVRVVGATVKNLGIENINLNSTSNYAGGIAGWSESGSVIQNCYVTGSIISERNYVGGIAGRTSSRTTVENCYVNITLSGNDNTGGLIGRIEDTVVRFNYTVAKLLNGLGTSRASFYGSLGSGNTYTENFLDGTIGSGNTGGSAIKSVSTTKMKTRSTYTSGWDFENVWQMVDGEYPTLQVFNKIEAIIKTINVNSYINNLYTQPFFARSINKYTNTHTRPLESLSKRHTATLRNTNTFTSSLTANVTQSSRTVKKSIEKLSTYIKPIHTQIDVIKSSIREQISHLESIESHNKRHVTTLKNIDTYVSNVFSDALRSGKRTGSRLANSHVAHISSDIKRKIVAKKLLDSYLKSIRTQTTVFSPLDRAVVNAYLSHLSNQTQTTILTNQTDITVVENQTELEVID